MDSHLARDAFASDSTDTTISLDPENWSSVRAEGHRMLDDMFDYLEQIRARPVWQPIPDTVRSVFNADLPVSPTDLAVVYREFQQFVMPYAAGNVHPGFMGWVHGGGTAVGMLAEMLAGGLNANVGGRDQMPLEVERQIVSWMRQLFGFPETSTGIFLTGTSAGNLMGVLIARQAELGDSIRQKGLEGAPLVAYTSTATHNSVARAMEIAGLGSHSLRRIPVDQWNRIDIRATAKSISDDRAAGLRPFMLIGTAGTVNTGAIDDLKALADLSEAERLWFHIDAAFGGLAMLSPDIKGKLEGIERADSLAFDFHKWAQVPYDAGFVLVRDGQMHRATFASPAAYLSPAAGGLAGGAPWPCDYGPELSRGFRALKTWFTLRVYGTERLGEMISHTCLLAQYLKRTIEATPELELMAPVELNIVCFRYRAADPDGVNARIVVDLHESGISAPSTTRLEGKLVIRAAIVNHRTEQKDIDALVKAVLEFGHRQSDLCDQP